MSWELFIVYGMLSIPLALELWIIYQDSISEKSRRREHKRRSKKSIENTKKKFYIGSTWLLAGSEICTVLKNMVLNQQNSPRLYFGRH